MIRRGARLTPTPLDNRGIKQGEESSLVDRLTNTIKTLTANKELINTRLATLTGESVRTASIIEISTIYRSLVTQIAVLYETEEFETVVAPFIRARFEELGRPSLIPGTIGSYVFGCYVDDYGLPTLDRFCTPICAASIRLPNRDEVTMRCTEKVIWTDGGDTPVFVLVEDDPARSRIGKVFIPWMGNPSSFIGLTNGAIDEIKSMDIDSVEIFGQQYNNVYVSLMPLKKLTDVPVVDRIRIRPMDYVAEKNGGTNLPAAARPADLPANSTHDSEGNHSMKISSSNDTSVERNNSTVITVAVVGGMVLIGALLFVLFLRASLPPAKQKKSP